MTTISQAAKAVFEAYAKNASNPYYYEGTGLVAALRAAVDQVVPAEAEPQWWQPVRPRLNRQAIRQRFLAIADELERTDEEL